MNDLRTELYKTSIERLPADGQQIIGYQDETSIVIYQAYKKSIAEFAVCTQTLGGPDFDYDRMSWIKPNFLWMMFRCGWASKESQEAVLSIRISKTFFLEILSNSVITSFKADYFDSHDAWKNALTAKPGRLQWDPDHDPFGEKLTRRAIQLGLKGDLLKRFGTQEIIDLKDITPFVKEQKKLLDAGQLGSLMIPYETIFTVSDSVLATRIGIGVG